jgi:lambda family phage portal protein
MNILDKAISYVSPEAGLRRVKARMALQTAEKLAYEIAKSGRRTDGWQRTGTSANAETSTSLVKARDSMRQLVRDNPLARKAVTELKTKAIGTGITPQARTGKPELNRKLDGLFDRWARECNADSQRFGFYAMQGLAARTIFESGECVLRFRTRRKSDGLTIPLQMQLLEPDFIDHTKTEQTDTGHIIQGVEFDKLGREIACWLFASHPGEVINTGWYNRAAGVSARVPTSSSGSLDGIERGYVIERPGMVRGMPWGVASAMTMYDLDGYEDAERLRKRLESCLAAFVTSPEAESPIGVQTTDDSGKLVEQFEPAMIVRTPPGTDVRMAEPKPAGGHAEYVRGEHRTIATGWLIPYEVLTGDLSQVNYSSYRGGLLGFRNVIEDFQWNAMIPFFCDPAWRRFIDALKIDGQIPADTPYDVEWAPPPFDLLDREAEARADLMELRTGKKTWPAMVGEQGLDPEKQLATISEWNKKFDDDGVVLDCDPRERTQTGAAQKTASSPFAA